MLRRVIYPHSRKPCFEPKSLSRAAAGDLQLREGLHTDPIQMAQRFQSFLKSLALFLRFLCQPSTTDNDGPDGKRQAHDIFRHVSGQGPMLLGHRLAFFAQRLHAWLRRAELRYEMAKGRSRQRWFVLSSRQGGFVDAASLLCTVCWRGVDGTPDVLSMQPERATDGGR